MEGRQLRIGFQLRKVALTPGLFISELCPIPGSRPIRTQGKAPAAPITDHNFKRRIVQERIASGTARDAKPDHALGKLRLSVTFVKLRSLKRKAPPSGA